MYKLIFADDEAIIRENISSMVNWREYGFELAGICANGHDLVETAEREQPDLVILDINMPYIDGITAAKLIKDEVPHAKLAFLTGYDDFGYAQKAVDLNVLKYILKPVTSEMMSETLSEIRLLLDKERHAMADYKQLKDFYDLNRGLLISAFIDTLLEGMLTDGEASAKISALRLDALGEGPYLSAIILNNGAGVTDELALNLLNCGIYNIVKEELEQNQLGLATMNGDKTALILCRPQGCYDSLASAASGSLERIHHTIRDSLKITVTIGVGKEHSGYGGISRSYREAVSALTYRHTLGGNHIIFIDDIEPHLQPIRTFSTLQERRLVDAIKSGDNDKIYEITEQLLLSGSTRDINQLRVYALSMMLSVTLEAERQGFSADLFLSIETLGAFFKTSSANSIYINVRDACLSLSKKISNQNNTRQRRFFRNTVHLLEERLSDAHLSVDDICNELHYSPSYFRTLFKKEAGVSFGAYLTQMRMEKAKQLLIETDQKGYLIAKQVGFNDPHYFSFCFKKHFHMTPREIREAGNVPIRELR